MNTDDDVRLLPQLFHRLAAGLFMLFDRSEIFPDEIGVPPDGFRRTNPPAVHENNSGPGHLGLYFRGIQHDRLSGDLPEREHALARSGKWLLNTPAWRMA